MKKLLAALLIFAMVISLSAALTSCKKDDDKPAEESAEKTARSEEPEPSVEPEPSEEPEPSVEPEPSEEPEPSVEPESSEEAAPPPEYKTSAAGTNYAREATYTVTRNGDSDPVMYLSYDKGSTDWADVECKKLNDGVWGDLTAYVDTEEAYWKTDKNALEGTTVQFVGSSAAFEFIFDLGDHYGDIRSLVFRNVRHGEPNGNNRGFEVKMVKASDDGVNWGERCKGEVSFVQVSGAPEIASNLVQDTTNVEHFDFTFTFNEVVQARYLKIILSNADVYVLQLEEIEIKN